MAVLLRWTLWGLVGFVALGAALAPFLPTGFLLGLACGWQSLEWFFERNAGFFALALIGWAMASTSLRRATAAHGKTCRLAKAVSVITHPYLYRATLGEVMLFLLLAAIGLFPAADRVR